MTDNEARELVKLAGELTALVSVRNTCRIQASQGPIEDRKTWKRAFKEAVRKIHYKEEQIARLMPSGAYQREMDLRIP